MKNKKMLNMKKILILLTFISVFFLTSCKGQISDTNDFVIKLADSTAMAEFKIYNKNNPKTISLGQLSLEYYNKTIEKIPNEKNIFQVNYFFNQQMGGEVLFQKFCIIVNTETKQTSFFKDGQKSSIEVTTTGIFDGNIINKYGYKINEYYIAISDLTDFQIEKIKGKKVTVSGNLLIRNENDSNDIQSMKGFVRYIKNPKITLYRLNDTIKIFPGYTLHNVDSSLHIISPVGMITVCTEKAIYHSETYENFLMKFLIVNESDKTVGVDLSNYWNVIYPNQWGIYPNPFREVINEQRLVPDTVNYKTDLIKKFKEKSLTMIEPHDTVAYYREWNGSGEKINKLTKNEYLIIMVDGQLTATDGAQTQQIILFLTAEHLRAVVFNYPVIVKNVPNKAIIIKNE